MERNRMFTGCILLTIITLALLWATVAAMQSEKRYKTEGVDVVVTVEEYYVIGKSHNVYGSYTYNGKKYSHVNVINCRNVRIGEELPCKVLLDEPFRADYVKKDKIFFYLILVIDGVFIFGLVEMITKYCRYCRIMDHGFLATGVIKSVQKREKEFYGIVEFEDFRENKYTVELCFGKTMKVPGQKCELKFMVDSKGKADAYFYDRRRAM